MLRKDEDNVSYFCKWQLKEIEPAAEPVWNWFLEVLKHSWYQWKMVCGGFNPSNGSLAFLVGRNCQLKHKKVLRYFKKKKKKRNEDFFYFPRIKIVSLPVWILWCFFFVSLFASFNLFQLEQYFFFFFFEVHHSLPNGTSLCTSDDVILLYISNALIMLWCHRLSPVNLARPQFCQILKWMN